MRQRPFIRRPPKNLVWRVNCGLNAFSAIDVAIIELASGQDIMGTETREHCNIKRMICDIHVGVQTTDINLDNSETWGLTSWMLLLVDKDDDSVYDPAFPETRQNELVLQDGILPRIGLRNDTQFPPSSLEEKTTWAVFPLTAHHHFDVKCNRRFTTDQVLAMYLTREAEAGSNEMNLNTTNNFACHVSMRTLFQKL